MCIWDACPKFDIFYKHHHQRLMKHHLIWGRKTESARSWRRLLNNSCSLDITRLLPHERTVVVGAFIRWRISKFHQGEESLLKAQSVGTKILGTNGYWGKESQFSLCMSSVAG